MSIHMDKRNDGLQQSIFDRYPWAAIHNDTITWLLSYMNENTESIIKQFDDRILQKVAKDHLLLAGGFHIA